MANPFDQFDAPQTGNPFDQFDAAHAANTGVNATNVVRAASRGIPIIGGLLDEADAATNAALDPVTHALGLTKEQIPGATFGERYNNELATQRGMDKGFDAAHPIISTGAQLAGGIASGSALTKAAPAVADTIFGGGATLPQKIVRGITTGAGIGGADSFTRGEGGFDNRIQDAKTGAEVGGVVGGVVPALTAGAGRMFGVKPYTPSGDDLRTKADDLYKAADNSGVVVKGTSFNQFANGLSTDMQREGIDPVLHPKANRALERILGATSVPGAPQVSGDVPIRDVETLRRIVGIGTKSAEPDERRVAGLMQDRLDNYLTGLNHSDVVGGDTQNVGNVLSSARDLWSRMSKGDVLDDLVDRAKLKTAQGGNSGTAITSEFKTLALNKAQMRRFSPDEQDAIRGVAEGDRVTQGLTKLSKLGHGMIGNLIALGGVATGHPEALAPKIVGETAGSINSGLIERRALNAADMMRNGGTMAGPRQMDPQTENLLRRLAASSIPTLTGAFR